MLLAAALSVLAASFSATAPAYALTPNENFTKRVYADFLFRDPTADEYTWWNAYLVSGTRLGMVTSILQDDEFQVFWVAGVNSSYLGYFDSTDPSIDTQISALASSNNYLATEVAVVTGAAYWANAGSTNTGYVTELFRDVLLREPDTSGLNYWVNRLNNGTSTKADVATTMIRSNEGATRRVKGLPSQTSCLFTTLEDPAAVTAGSYCIVLDRMSDPTGATYWIGQLTGSSQLPTFWANLAASNEYFNGAQ